MSRSTLLGLLAGALVATAPVALEAQDAPQRNYLAVGQMAPDFEVAAGSRYGVLQQPFRLSDYRGETVVVAFYFRARTRG